MARIDEIKKKAKLSMDEMYSCSADGKVDCTAVSTETQQTAKEQYSKKVTWYLTPRLFKVFNDIYATRMLEDRKTDKSELIAEAIELLAEKEKMRKKGNKNA